MQLNGLMGLVSIILFFAVPIVAIVLSIVAVIKHIRQNAELRKEILHSGASIEMAELLIKKPNKEKSKVVSLRWGATFVGVGLAAIVCKLAGLYISDVYTWLYLALGGGVGLVVAFVVEMILTKRNPQPEQDK